MPIYQYSGLNAEGRTERGMIPGSSKEAVTRRLQAKGIEIQELSVAESSGDPLAAPSEAPRGEGRWAQMEAIGPLGGKVPLHHLQFFFRQLASMLGAGIGSAQALTTLAGQARSPRLKQVLEETKRMVVEGQPISAGLQGHPDVFTPLMLSMVRAGEEGGFLSDQCIRMSEYIEREIELRNMIRRETAYPKIAVVLSIIVVFVTNWIIKSLGKPDAVMLVSPLTEASTWFILGPIIIALFVYFKIIKRQPRAQYGWDKFAVHVPYIGSLVHGFCMAKFGRSFGALYGSGVPLPKALKLSADACGNEYVRAQIYPAAADLEAGQDITDAFARTGAFSPIVLDMTRTGETTGNVDEMLNKMAEFYEGEGTVRARQVAIAVSVFCFLLVGLYVAYVYITNMMRILGGPVQQNL